MENTNTMPSTPIAIIGMAGIYAGAHNAPEFWDNILNKIDCITEVPPSRWDIADYYDPDPTAPDKTYCKRGGFIPDIDFNPLEFGLPPNILEVTDTSQLLGLVVARDVLDDAGYGNEREFDRSRTGVILGVAGGLKLITPLTSRLQYPVWRKALLSSGIAESDADMIIEKMKLAYVEWQENSFPGALGNVIAGRIANRFDLGGINNVVDAACGSSLAAVQMAMDQLLLGRVEMMITGGVDTDNSIFTYLCFSKTPAFSRKNESRPFDAEADGMLSGEGVGMLALKRLADAERDGDRIYAVIRGIGAASDGRFKSIYAPRPEGQTLAMRRAYAAAGCAPETVGLIEAHGTGTPAGDPAEFEGLRGVFTGNGQHIALGSIKSQIGHTKAAAGAAGLIKATLALHHKILPPTINVTQPNPKLDLEHSPFYVNTEARPWIRAEGAPPRRAGVSAFGFGGTNFHVVLEEYAAEQTGPYRIQHTAQPVILFADSPAELLARGNAALAAWEGASGAQALADLAAASAGEIPTGAARLGFVADSAAEATALLKTGLSFLEKQQAAEAWEHPKGIFYRQAGLETAGKIVALFPGQGSQYLNMGREAALAFPPLREIVGRMDALFLAEGLTPLSRVLYPIPAFDDAAREAQEAALRATDYAQAAIGVLSAGLYKILEQAGFRPDFTAGHSFGELSALWAGGALDDATFLALVKARGKAMAPPPDAAANADFDAGTMLAVKGDLAEIEKIVAALEGVSIANQNSPTQVVLAGATEAIEQAAQVFTEQGFKATRLNVSAAFHTPLVAHASAPFAAAVRPAKFHKARVPVYSNTTGKPYPTDAKAAKEILANHILHPVIFKTQIEAIYAAGGRIFVEIGPRRVVTNLVSEILADKPHVAVALNASRDKSSDRQLREAVVQLKVAGVPLGEVDPYCVKRETSNVIPVGAN